MMCWNPESAQIDSTAAEDSVEAADLANKIKSSGYKNINIGPCAQASRTKAAEFASALQQQLNPENFYAWQQHAHRVCTSQTAQTDLASALTAFCLSKLNEQSKLTSERLK
jgi:hypothetical protein